MSANIIGSLAISLGLNTASFQSDLKRTRKATKSFGKMARREFKSMDKAIGRSIKNAVSSLASFKSALVVVAGIAGIGLLIKSSLTAIDAVGKMSKTYGIATKDLGAFTLAAELGGSSLKLFTKAAKNISKNVFDFATLGIGEAKDAFKVLGISVDDLKPIMNDNVALIGLIGDKLNTMEDGAIKTALAVKILGGRAVELLPALAGGSKQFEEYRKQSELMGLSLSTSMVRGVEAANDSMSVLSLRFKALRDQTTGALAPGIKLVADRLNDLFAAAIESGGGIGSVAKTMATSLVNGANMSFKAIGTLVTAFEFLGRTVDGVKLIFKIATSAIVGFAAGGLTGLDKLNKGAASLINLLPGINITPSPDLTNWANTAAGTFGVLNDEIVQLAESMANTDTQSMFSVAIKNVDQYTSSIIKAVEAGNKITEQKPSAKISTPLIGGVDNKATTDSLGKRFELLQSSQMSETQMLTETLNKQLDLVKAAQASGIANDKEALDARIGARSNYWDRIGQLNNSAQERERVSTYNAAQEYTRAWDAAGNRFASGIGDAVADVMFKNKTFAESMKAITAGVIRQIISSMVEIRIKQTELFAVGESQKATSTATSVASNTAIAVSAVPAAAGVSLATAGANSIPAVAGILATLAAVALISKGFQGGFADGGNFVANRPMLIGEKGPEILVPSTGGTILPNSAISNNSNRNYTYNVTQVFEFKGGNNAGDSIVRNRAQIENIAVNAIRNAARENGRPSPI